MIRETDGKFDTIDHQGNWHVLVWGLKPPEQELELAPGLTLRSLRHRISVFDLAAAGSVGFREWAVLEPIADACLSEIESARDADTTPGYDTRNRAWLAAALLVLRGYTRQMCVGLSSYSWNLVAGHQMEKRGALPEFKGKLLDFHTALHLNQSPRSGPVTKEDAIWVGAHFSAFNRLASENESFRFALEAAIDWRYAKDPRAAISRLWGGIEAIFGVRAELVYRISISCASLLSKRGPERTKMFYKVKQLYDMRSKAVHGGALSEERLSQGVGSSFELLSGLILAAVAHGQLPSVEDVDRAIFE